MCRSPAVYAYFQFSINLESMLLIKSTNNWMLSFRVCAEADVITGSRVYPRDITLVLRREYLSFLEIQERQKATNLCSDMRKINKFYM